MKTKKIFKLTLLLLTLMLLAFFFQTVSAQKNEELSSLPKSDEKQIDSPIDKEQAEKIAKETVNCFDYYKLGAAQVNLFPSAAEAVSGSKLEFKGELSNEADYPLVNMQVWAMVMRNNPEGEEKNGYHQIDQFVALDNINLNPKEKKKISFYYQVPKSLPEDKYYLATVITSAKHYEITGATFLPNVWASFASFDIKSNFKKSVYLDRNTVTVDGESFIFRSPFPPLAENQDHAVKFNLVNQLDTRETVKVIHELNFWDAQEKNSIKKTEETITLEPNSQKELQYVLKNLSPGTYNLQIKAESEIAKSIMDIRLGTNNVQRATVFFAGLDRFPINPGEKVKMFACFHNAGYGPGYNGEITLELKDKDNNIITQKSYRGFIPGNPLGIVEEFEPKKTYDYLELVSIVRNTNGSAQEEVKTVYGQKPSQEKIKPVGSGKDKTGDVGLVILIICTILLVGAGAAYFVRKKKGYFNILLAVGVTALLFALGSRSANAQTCGNSWRISYWKYFYNDFLALNINGYVNTNSGCLFKQDNNCIPNGHVLTIGQSIYYSGDYSGEWIGSGFSYTTPPYDNNWYPIGYWGVQEWSEEGLLDLAYLSFLYGYTKPPEMSDEKWKDFKQSLDRHLGRTEARSRIANAVVNIASSNPSVLAVDGKKVTAVGAGKATITVFPKYYISFETKEKIQLPSKHFDRVVENCPIFFNISVTSPCTPNWSCGTCQSHQITCTDLNGCNSPTYTYCNQPPTIDNITIPNSIYVNESKTFSATATDHDVPAPDNLKYRFEWGDGTSDESDWVDSGTSVSFSHKYDTGGNKTLTVKVTDNGTDWVKETRSISVNCPEIDCATKQLCEGEIFSSCDSTFCTGGASCNLNSDKKSWRCSNSCGSKDCAAYVLSKENGVCGSWDGCNNQSAAKCEKGNFEEIGGSPDDYEYQWKCKGSCGGADAVCFAKGKKACGWIETNP